MGSCFDCSKNNHIFSPSSLPGRRFKEKKKNIKCFDFVVGLPLFSVSLALFKIRFIYGTGESSFFFFNFSQPLQKSTLNKINAAEMPLAAPFRLLLKLLPLFSEPDVRITCPCKGLQQSTTISFMIYKRAAVHFFHSYSLHTFQPER